jgi:protein ImuB
VVLTGRMRRCCVDHLACVDLPGFPLQLLCRKHPEWGAHPVVVVPEDKPQALILWVNERARRSGILPGQRYAHGLALDADLRAGVVAPHHIASGVELVAGLLRDYSPEVEPAAGEPGVFWLNAAGMGRLYSSAAAWAQQVRDRLRKDGLHASVVVGFTRFGTYAVARQPGRAVTVFADRAAEKDAAHRVAIDRLGLDPALRDTLAKLGVFTLGGFLRLPAGGLLERFGADAFRMHQLAAGDRWDPLRPEFAPEQLEQRVLLDDPEGDVTRLLFVIKRAVDRLLEALVYQKNALTALVIEFQLDRHDPESWQEIICPAEPTLNARSLLRLVHLRLESSPPPAGVVEILLTAASVPATHQQLALFERHSRYRARRDLRAANEAFARLRAEFGNDVVVKARLRDGHLPEASYTWERMECAAYPSPRAIEVRPLVRRILHKPILLPPQHHQVRDDGWLLQGLEHGAVARFCGPYIVSGGWWNTEVHREYHFAEMRRGECLWIYYDRRRRRWFLQGQVE